MTIGASIFLIVVGAILKFATNWHVDHVNLDTVGIILMIAGVVGLILGFVQQAIASRRPGGPDGYRGPGDPPSTY